MDFEFPPEVEAFRAEVREFLEEHLTPDVRQRVRDTGSMHDWRLHRALAAKGWIAASWPKEYGGAERNPLETMVMREEMRRQNAPLEGLGTVLLIANAVREFGSAQLRREILPRVTGGEILMCLGYSEPQGGSDVANARTRAVPEGDDWVINGQKVFTTLAEESAYCLLLTRTNPDVPKHKGLTLFLVPMDSPGITIDPIRTLGGERTNQVFYADVRVPDRWRVGAVDGAWDVLMAALAFERRGIWNGRLLAHLVATVRSAAPDAPNSITNPTVREHLARLAIDGEVDKLLARRSGFVEATGGVPIIEGSMHKLFSAETRVRNAAVVLDLLGADGLRELDDPAAPGGGHFAEEFRHAVIWPIWGGASEVMRKIIAERHLRLPRST